MILMQKTALLRLRSTDLIYIFAAENPMVSLRLGDCGGGVKKS